MPRLASSSALVAILLLAPSVSAQVTLPFVEDWEGTNGETYSAPTASLVGAPEWSFTPLGTGGRLRLAAGPGFYASGSAAATLDTTGSATVANHLVLTLDMSSYNTASDNVVVDFAHMQHGEESHAGDRIWVRGSFEDPFVPLYNLTQNAPPPGQYQLVTDVDITTTLLFAGQGFSPTFALRFGQEDNLAATSPGGVDGRTFDDIVLRRVPDHDVLVTQVTLPADQTCGEALHPVEIEVNNLGNAVQVAIPVQVVVSGDLSATFAGMVSGPLLKNQPLTVQLGTLDTFAGANLTLEASTQLANDEVPGNDTLTVTRSIAPMAISLAAPPSEICPGEPAIVAVAPEPQITFALYDVPTGGTPLALGETLTTPPVDAATTFYLERERSFVAGGPQDDSIGMSGPYGTYPDGLTFDVTTPVVIGSVAAYPQAAGLIQIALRDATNAVIGSSDPYTVMPADVGTKTRVPVGLSVPAGTGYTMTAEGSTALLSRNTTGAAYPYAVGGALTITGNTPMLPSAYYFFYDWTVAEDMLLCNAARTPVDVAVNPALCAADLSVALSGPASALPGEMLELETTVTNQGPHVALAASLDIVTPAGLTLETHAGDCTTTPCALGDLPAGATALVTSTFTVDEGFAGEATVTADGSHDSAEAQPGDESAALTVAVEGEGGSGGASAGSGGSSSSTSGTGGSGTSEPPASSDDGGCGCRLVGPPRPTSSWWLLGLAGVALALRARRR